ncbi:MAG: polyphosphate polymerase domain-containing protein [Bacteroidetes bacterium]|nr:polyphosphate polymerase domain-containing protein [Bacteroidota bacterium]
MTEIHDILGSFNPITLEEMDAVKLLDRVDRKYVFPVAKLFPLLRDLDGNYRILEINGIRLNRYETLYFDTEDHRLYLHHHNGKLNRFKVRSRSYLDSGQSFFEVKFKNNKGRTVKNRIKRKEIKEEISGKALKLLAGHTPLDPESLKPALRVYFSRITLVNSNLTERITLDIDLHFLHNGTEKKYPGLVVAELKQARSQQSPFHLLLREHHITPFSISKYCLGICSLNKEIKQNNFKQKLIHINHINHEAL